MFFWGGKFTLGSEVNPNSKANVKGHPPQKINKQNKEKQRKKLSRSKIVYDLSLKG